MILDPERCVSGFALVLRSREARATRPQLGLRPRGSRYALARASPSRFALRAHGSRYALAAWALPLRLALRACCLGFVLAVLASPSRLALRARGSGFSLPACTTRSRIGLHPRGSCFAECILRRMGTGHPTPRLYFHAYARDSCVASTVGCAYEM